MFIVWRQKPVVSDRRVELFVKMDPSTGRRATGGWKPICCDHVGPGRVTHTLKIMMSERVGGKVKQKFVRHLPSIRSCCIDSWVVRSAWWAEVDVWRNFTEGGPEVDFVLDHRDAIDAKLCSVVPVPTMEMRRLWSAYVEEMEEARRAEQRRREQPYYRWQSPFSFTQADPWWQALGVKPTATAVEVKEAYRALVKKYHPDRGGDPDQFRKVQEAYEAYERITGVTI